MLPERPSACHAFFCFFLSGNRSNWGTAILAVGRAGILPAVAREKRDGPFG
jgi:hypothetical protein